MVLGDSDALLKAQNRPPDHERPLPKHIYKAASGVTFSSSTFSRLKINSVTEDIVDMGWEVSKIRHMTKTTSTRGTGNRFYQPFNMSTGTDVEIVPPDLGMRNSEKPCKLFFRSTPIGDALERVLTKKKGDSDKGKPVKRAKTIFTADEQNIASFIINKYNKAPINSMEKEISGVPMSRNPFRIGNR